MKRNPVDLGSDGTEKTSSAGSRNRAVTSPATHDDTARRAYEIYVNSGSRPGQCEQNWLQAEQELLPNGRSLSDALEPTDEESDSDGHGVDTPDLGSSHLNLSGIETEQANVR